MYLSHNSMTEYQWNGVGITTPDIWEPSALERDGFLLECNGHPMCELKWRVVQGTFSFTKHLKRLAKGNKGVDMQGVPLEETPERWQASAARLTESGMKFHSFIWKTPHHKGIGAAVHNPATGLALLIQFFIVGAGEEDDAATVLSTLRDYTGGKTIPWSIFGLKARIPSEYALNTFAFKPGHYMIKYWRPKSSKHTGRVPAGKGAGTALVFERYAPASVLLKDAGLEPWVIDNMEHGPSENVTVEAAETSLRWTGISKTSTLRKLLRRTVHTSGRVWTTETGNSILAAHTEGVVPMDDETFNTICESYELV